jgi:1-phosphofructokinase family hexose kinase
MTLFLVSMANIHTIAFNPSLDKLIVVDRLSGSGEVRERDARIVAGGKAVNVARAFQTLGVPAGVFGIAAGASGSTLEEWLGAEKIPQEWLWASGETRTNVTLQDARSGCAVRILESGPRVSSAVLRDFRKTFQKKLGTLNAAVFSGSLPPGISPATFAGFITMARRANVLTALDTSGPALAAGLKARPFIVKPNRAEAEELCGFRIRSIGGIRKALRYLSRYSNIVLISLGEEGLAGSDSARMFLARGPVSRRGLEVGCGDVALAGFLAGFFRGEAFEDCLRSAAACGGVNVGAERPGAFSLRKVRMLTKKINVERL